MRRMYSQYGVVVVSSLLFVGLFAFSVYRFQQEAKAMVSSTIAHDVTALGTIFDKIQQTCGITGFDHDRNYIDFLTVRSFASSQVGAMHLLHPEKWDGPYVQDNPTVQGKLYEIVSNKDGYYIVPGKGVRLSNGKIIGTDIIFTYQSDIEAYVNEAQGLEYKGKPLVRRITSTQLPDTCCLDTLEI